LFTKNRLIPFQLKAIESSFSQYFTCLSIINDSSFLAGTYFNGIYKINKKGYVLENVSTRNGLPNNTVRCLFTHINSTWAGFDNGIAYFNFNNPIKHLNPSAFNNGVGYGAKLFEGDIFFALSTGLQWIPANKATDLSTIVTEPKSILGGLTWNLSIINNQLLAARDDGFWLIKNKQPFPITQATGYWTYQPIANTSPLQIAAGNYSGIELFEYNNGQFIDIGLLAKFTESSRYIETDNNNIWISHPYRGIYKISIRSKAVTLFNHFNGLPSNLDNHVFKIKNKILFATLSGIYTYDSVKNIIVPSKEYIDVFGKIPIRYLKEDELGNIWFVKDKMVGVADYSTGKPVIHFIPELKNKILSGFENIFTLNSKNIIIASEKGFYHLNYEKYLKAKQPFTTYLTQIKTIGSTDSVLYGGYDFSVAGNKKALSISYRLNSLHFNFAASLFSQYYDMEFSYFLDGFDQNWSEWDLNTNKDYTNLPAGEYTFNIKARTSPSHESAIYSYSFIVKPPWYKSFWSYLFYTIILIVLLYRLSKYQEKKHRKAQEVKRLADKKKYEERQKQMAYEHQIELEHSEKELIRLTNQNLETEIKHKTNELASVTMNLVQKKEFILKLKAELQQLQKNTKIGEDNIELKKLLKVLAEEEKLNDEWEHFSQHFNSVHGNFLTLLKNKFPSLKPHELRLCAYLRMNLSSKEIAPLMSISVRGVEISRYRLRKKINLSTEANLVQYLLDIESGKI
ncbi:MAG: triple tyrosine motif-containing protein, partial [Limnohabitans sp.]|nr:triple tyrosine motif-containing protein [Limnohabitans sp.]